MLARESLRRLSLFSFSHARRFATVSSSLSAPSVSPSSSSSIEHKLVTVKVNGKEVQVPEYASVLEACKKAGAYVPTLCNHPQLPVKGTCRLCLVQLGNDSNHLKPSCATTVYDQLEVQTDTKQIREFVKRDLQLLLRHHPNACMTCEVNGRCELQDLIYRYQVTDWGVKLPPEHEWDDDSTASIVQDLDKCVRCGRCVRACQVLQGMNVLRMAERGSKVHPATFDELPLDHTSCIECGQCAAVCPVGAIIEKPEVHLLLEKLERVGPSRPIHIAQTAPSTRVAIGEELGLEPGSVSTGQLVAALRRLGFDYVFDTNFSADLTILEEGTELLNRVKSGGPFPMFTSCCPGWVNLVEKSYPEFVNNLSTARSPQQMLGSMAKTYFANKLGKSPSDLCVTSFMPCTAKKGEANRPQFQSEDGVRDVDHVLTTRELGHLIRAKHIPFASLKEEEFDNPFGLSTGAAVIFGVTGGVMEAALRTAYELYTGNELPHLQFHPVRGLQGIKECSIPLGDGNELSVAVVHGTSRVRHLMDKIERGEKAYHFVEVMACPGGCIGGGGQPKSLDPLILSKRMNAIYSIDERSVQRKSHENLAVSALYKEFLGEPCGEKSHHLLHTHYNDRSSEITCRPIITHVPKAASPNLPVMESQLPADR